MADLKTMVDRELGSAVAAGVAYAGAVQHARAATTPAQLSPTPTGPSASYGVLSERNPEWLGDYWHRCRALYAGGPRLLLDEKVMDALFPSHANEAKTVYEQRRARAFYLAYAGEIIDHLLAGFAADPIRLTAGVDEAKNGEEKPIASQWSDFAADVSPPGGKRQPLSSFAVDCLREMFITQNAWVLVDLPTRDPDAPAPANRLDEERQGLLDPYLCLMPSENVVEWECDEETGELEWALCHWRSKRRGNLHASRSKVTERWTYWDRTHWERYEIEYDPRQAPRPETPVSLVATGEHTFGVVPLVRLHVPDGLYAMGKLESIAREHFNKRNAAAWAEYKALFSVLYEFLAPPTVGAFTPNQAQDPNRAVNQVRGQGWSQLRGEKDRAEFIGPDVNAFHEARESCAELMREMHRVMFSMALSANMDSAALSRSGESKGKDAAQIAAILAKVGEIVREGIDVVLDLVATVRKESERTVRATGGEKFDADSIAASLEEAVALLNGVPMKSPTFLKRYLYRIYKLALGAGATSKDLDEVRKELDDQVTAEAMLAADASPPGPADERGKDDEDEDDESDNEKDDPPARAPSRPVGQPRSRRIVSA